MPSSHLILCHPLFLLPPIPPSLRVFSNESALRMRWPKYWSFSFCIIPSKEIPGLISFRMDWLDLLAVQGTLKGLLQHHSSKASILWRSAFFRVQLSHPYMTTGKTIALTRWTFVGKVMSLLLNMLSRLVITFLPSSKRLLISWLQSPSAVILEPQKINLTVFTVSPSISHEVMGLDPKICHAESCSNNEFNSMQALVLGYSRPFGLWSLFSNLWMEYIDKGILDPRDDVQMTRQLWINYWFWECNNMLQDQVSCYGPVLSLFAY